MRKAVFNLIEYRIKFVLSPALPTARIYVARRPFADIRTFPVHHTGIVTQIALPQLEKRQHVPNM
jgi:hypothetical protein